MQQLAHSLGETKSTDPAETCGFQLRPYQTDAVAALFRYFADNDGQPLLSLPTGSGKSIIQAAFIRQTIDQWPGERFLLLTHVKELIQQNAAKLKALGVPVGIYSAGLGRRELNKDVTLAGIQSIYKRAHEVGRVSIVMIDECHLVSKHGNTMYQAFLRDLKKYNPHLRVIGMSATPFRLDSGPLIKGKQRIFTDIAYSIDIKQLIGLGYLAPLISAPVETRADTSNVKKRGGEYIPGDLERVMLDDDVTRPALDEVERLCADRKSWLVFCVGVLHAEAVRDALQARGYAAETITAETKNRDRLIDDFRQGRLRALVSVGVLTTGFDAPCADALICLRPTLSPGLWVQIVGRVGRLHPGKENGLVLDFTSNTAIHGPVDMIDIDGDGEVNTAPARVCEMCGAENKPSERKCVKCGHLFVKDCPKCMAPVAKTARVCPDCGHWFRIEKKPDHNTKATSKGIISGGEVEPDDVEGWRFTKHKKIGRPDSMRVWYMVGLREFSEWVCFDHGGYVQQKASTWWAMHRGTLPTPMSTDEALVRVGELTRPETVKVTKEGKYWRVE